MKANSRRRVLISSLAMLLVALVALSTATFAWFTTNTTATADGMEVKTVKASKLVICDDTQGWNTLIDYGVDDKALLPVSSATGSAWYKADAQTTTASTAKEGTYAAVTALGSYVVKDQLNIKNEGETAINNVTVTIEGLSDYVRVALVPTSAQGTTVADTGTFANCIIDADGEGYSALSAADGTTVAITPNSCLNEETGKLDVGNLTPGAAVYYNLYVWFEGQDTDCYDTNQNYIENLKFTVNGEPVA